MKSIKINKQVIEFYFNAQPNKLFPLDINWEMTY